MERETKVEVVSLDILEGQGVLKAVADVGIGELLIRGFRVIQKEGRPLRVSVPAMKRRADDGSIEYRPIIVIMFEGLKRRIEGAILDVYRAKKGQ